MSDLSVRERRVWTAGVVVAACFAVVVGWQALSNQRQRAAFRAYVERLHSAGEPTTPRELYGPEPLDDVNAAPEIRAALKGIYEVDDGGWTRTITGPWDDKFWGDGGPWFERATPEQMRDLGAFLVRVRPFLDRIASALERPRCRFPLAIDDNGWPMGDGLQTMQRVTRVLGARALADPDPAARISTCATLLLLADRFEPVGPIDYIGSSVAAQAAVTALRRGVEMGTIEAASARARLDALVARRWLDEAPRVLAGDVVQLLVICDAALVGRGKPPDPRYMPFKLDFTLGFRSAPLAAVSYCGAYREASRWPVRPLADWMRRAKAMAKAVAADEAGRRDALTIPETRLVVLLARMEAVSSLARVALAAVEHRSKAGDFPKSLDELKPLFPDGVPLDPFTDAPFVYEKTATGVRIASAGRLAEDPPVDAAALRERCLVWELKR